MKRFLVVIFAIVFFCFTSVIAFSAPKNVSLSDYPSLESMLSQFDQGDGNYLLPYSFERSDGLTSFLKYYNDDTGKYIKLFSYNSKYSNYISFYFAPKIWSGKSLKSALFSGPCSYCSSSSYHAQLYISGTSSTHTPFMFFQFKYDSDKNVFVNSSSHLTNYVLLYCPITSIVSFFPDELVSLTSPSSYVRRLSDVSSISFIDAAEYVPPVTGRTLTVNYLYTEDRPAADPVTQTIAAGEEYSIQSPEIEGYTPSIPLVTGTMPDEDLTVDVYYTKAFYPLTVKYQHQDGSRALADVVYHYPAGFSYDVPTPDLPGYRPDKLTVAGTMPGMALEEVVTYTAKSYTFTIDYVYENGARAAPSHTERLTTGAAYSVPSPEIEGYTPGVATVTGVMPGADKRITVIYRRASIASSSAGSGTGGDGSSGESSGSSGPGGPSSGGVPPFSGSDPFEIGGFPSYTQDPFSMSLGHPESEYLAFSPEYLYHIASMLRENIGTIFSVAIYAFLVILTIYTTLHVVDMFE